MRPFVGDAFDEATFRRLIGEAYAAFETPEVAPLKPLGETMRLLRTFDAAPGSFVAEPGWIGADQVVATIYNDVHRKSPSR